MREEYCLHRIKVAHCEDKEEDKVSLSSMLDTGPNLTNE